MEVRKTIKKVVALAAGASMVGATLFGASAAADLANYPNPFIKDGVFDAVLVVGDKAKAEDVIGVTDIAVSLQFASKTVKKAGTAAVLSFFIPGVGQIYNGAFLRGIFWLIVTPGFWIGSGGTLGWICHLISAYTAYNYANKHSSYNN